MKKALSILALAAAYIASAAPLNAAVRDGAGNASRAGNTSSQRVTKTTTNARSASAKTTVLRGTAARSTTTPQRTTSTISRATTQPLIPMRVINTRTPSQTPVKATTSQSVTARATTSDVTFSTTDTRTGAEYENCKNAYFTCMDQFCQLKNDDYRRCSCSDRVYELSEIRKVMQEAGQDLTVFNENLDTVGMTAAQATAMRTASDGENALTEDTSASKALLQAIMNSIRGEDASVGGKYSDLNSIQISFDTVNAFGVTDAGQAIAAYNGQTLYSAVYPNCRSAVRADCNDASLQRAITAYLMAVEQDCNTVATAIEENQKKMKSAIRESSAMLDLARVENRRKHNSSDITTCINEVETAILSEQVCGSDYHKCLDNGQFIDLTTGAPIAGVENFYELEKLLTFTTGVDAANQKLAQNNANREFVLSFEAKTKKFARDALDKCVEQADIVWQEYLDKAMLAIYYAQKAKVAEVKQGCFDFVSACYTNTEQGLTAAMKELTGGADIVLQPDKINLSNQMCNDYIASCDSMFDNNIIKDYVDHQTEVDSLTACRAVVKQCFDKFGGTNYENFYYPYSGLFKTGEALDWFSLYDENKKLLSPCAQQLKDIESCSKTPEDIEAAFGGMDRFIASLNQDKFTANGSGEYNGTTPGKHKKYGLLTTDNVIDHHTPRPTGVATEIFNQIVDTLTIQCTNIQGRFIELQYIRHGMYREDNLCLATFENSAYQGDGVPDLIAAYSIGTEENMCPREYDLNVDTQSWGACLCWENGGRRSKWGKSPKCIAGYPVLVGEDDIPPNDSICKTTSQLMPFDDPNFTSKFDAEHWCTAPAVLMAKTNQVCPISDPSKTIEPRNEENCQNADGITLYNLPDGLGKN